MATRAERHGLQVSRCESCDRPIAWIELDGKWIPLDASAPVYHVEERRDGELGPSKTVAKLEHAYVSHFNTCPKASYHSKGGAARAPSARR